MNKISPKVHFEKHYRRLVERYNTYDTEKVHQKWIFDTRFKGLNILDVGSGSGRDALYYSSHGAKVTAIDFSSSMVRYAKAKDTSNTVNWIVDELPKLDTQKHNPTFDLIVATAVFMFLSPEEQILALKRLFELLCNKGRLIITFKEDLEDDCTNELSPHFISTAQNLGFEVQVVDGGKDSSGRKDVTWTLFIFSL